MPCTALVQNHGLELSPNTPPPLTFAPLDMAQALHGACAPPSRFAPSPADSEDMMMHGAPILLGCRERVLAQLILFPWQPATSSSPARSLEAGSLPVRSTNNRPAARCFCEVWRAHIILSIVLGNRGRLWTMIVAHTAVRDAAATEHDDFARQLKLATAGDRSRSALHRVG
eukprot:408026-Amphidinium_carterae.3